jgi:hypothetical protein
LTRRHDLRRVLPISVLGLSVLIATVDVAGSRGLKAILAPFTRGGAPVAVAASTLAARVHDEFECDRLTVALATALERTMQPASAWIWLWSGGYR